MKGLIAKKVGMTQVFDESGNLTPVTVIRVEPNTVVATKKKENCGYDAVVLGLDDLKPSKVNKAYAGQFTENVTPKRTLKEFRDFEGEVKIGDQIGVELFEQTRFLDVTATSKGKGFQGVMKRWASTEDAPLTVLSSTASRAEQANAPLRDTASRTLSCLDAWARSALRYRTFASLKSILN